MIGKKRNTTVPIAKMAKPNGKTGEVTGHYAKIPHDKTGNDEWLKLALEAAKMGIWSWDIETNEVKWSENVHHFFGLKNSSAFEGSFDAYFNLIHGEDKEKVMDAINKSLHSDVPYHSEHRLLYENGKIRWVESVGNLLRDEEGKPLRITGTLRDITERKKIEQEREEWKARYDLIAISSEVVIYDYDIHSGNIIWSGNILDVLGYQPSEMGDIKHWERLIHPEDREKSIQELNLASKESKIYDVEYRFLNKKENYIYMHDRGFFVYNEHRTACRMIGMMTDISSRKMSEQKMLERELFIKRITESIPEIIYLYDLGLEQNIYINREIGTTLGYSPGEYTGNMGLSFVHPEDLERLPSLYEKYKSAKDDEIIEVEYRMQSKQGDWRWFAGRDRVFLRSANGDVKQMIGVTLDITDLKKAEYALRESEERFRNLIKDINVGVLLQGSKAEMLLCNKAALDLLGVTEEQLLGKTSFDPAWNVIHEDGSEFPGHTHPVPVAIATLKPVTGVIMGIYRPNTKSLVWLLVNAKPILGKDHDLVHVICTFTDITERKKAEEAIKESQQRFQMLLKASYGGIILHDKEKIIDYNQGLLDLFGYTNDELIGKNILTLVAPSWKDFVKDKIVSHDHQPYDMQGLRKDGSKFYVEVHDKHILLDDRQIEFTEFRDITERKLSEARILVQNTKLTAIADDLKRKNKQLEEFTQIVSHNLRSPVSNLLTLINLYETEKNPGEKQHFYSLLKISSTNVYNTLEELNDVLKVKQTHNIEKQELKFEKVFEYVKSMLNAKITEISAEVKGDFSLAPVISYPNIYLESIFLNLLSNSLKYHQPGRKPEITFKTYYKDNNLMLEVLDNGLGINLEKYGQQIFKLRKVFHRHPESRGVGLFLIKNQIETMGGEIFVVSEEGKGAVFFINFDKNS